MTDYRIRSTAEDFDIDARDEQVSGNPRIAPMLPEEFTDEAQALVKETFSHVARVDHSDVPPFFGIMFKHPGLSRATMQLGLELGAKGHIPPRERELAVLRVAWLTRAPFEWGEHLVQAQKAGLSDEEIERITSGSDAPGWDEHDKAILRATEEMIGDYAISTASWDILAKRWTEPQLMELPGLVGHYIMGALIHNSIRFDLLDGNNGLRRR